MKRHIVWYFFSKMSLLVMHLSSCIGKEEPKERTFVGWIPNFFLLVGLLPCVWCWQDDANSCYKMAGLQHVWWKVEWEINKMCRLLTTKLLFLQSFLLCRYMLSNQSFHNSFLIHSILESWMRNKQNVQTINNKIITISSKLSLMQVYVVKSVLS
jgi:hypothetical protein